jgi:ribonucleoside-diphosphate reductase subunit M1
LAARIAISNLHKETKKSFSQVVSDLYNFGKRCFLSTFKFQVPKRTYPAVNPKTGKSASLISQETYDVVSANAATLDAAIIYNRDFNYN